MISTISMLSTFGFIIGFTSRRMLVMISIVSTLATASSIRSITYIYPLMYVMYLKIFPELSLWSRKMKLEEKIHSFIQLQYLSNLATRISERWRIAFSQVWIQQFLSKIQDVSLQVCFPSSSPTCLFCYREATL